jgi:hypothetical protein
MYHTIYMDYNSPIYREKYLKYKKKYTELKNFEQEGGMKFFASNPAKAINKEMSLTFTLAKTNAINDLDNKLQGLQSSQKTAIKKDINIALSEGMLGLAGKGPIKKDIDNNKSIDKSAIELLKGFYTSHLKTDTIKNYVDTQLTEKLDVIHKEVSGKVKTEEVKTKNKEVSVETIKALNDQLNVESYCEKAGVEVSACDKTKIETVTLLTSVLRKMNNAENAYIKESQSAHEQRNKYQDKMNELGSKYSGEDGQVVKDFAELENKVKDASKKKKKDFIDALGLKTIEPDNLNRETLIAALANPDTKITPEALGKLKELDSPPSPKPDTSSPKSPNATKAADAPKAKGPPESKAKGPPESKAKGPPESKAKGPPAAKDVVKNKYHY